MKSLLLSFGLSIVSFSVFAQINTDNNNKSVFNGFHKMKQAVAPHFKETIQKTNQHFPGMMVTLDQMTGNISDVFGNTVSVNGTTPLAKAQNVMTQQLSDFGINPNDWVLTRDYNAGHAHFVSYKETKAGREVVFSRLSFRFTPDGKLQRIQLSEYGNPANNIAPTLSVTDAKQIVDQDLTNITVSNKTVDANWVWFPVPSANGYELRPAYSFRIEGMGKSLPADLQGYIDAGSGEILYRQNKVHDFVDRTVKGDVYKQNPMLPSTIEPLANLELTIGTTNYNTDSNGYFSNASLATPITATMKLQGKWSKVSAALSSNVTPSFLDTITLNGGTYIFPIATPSSQRHVNAYFHVNRVHDYQKGQYPAFTGMDIMLPTNVDVTGTCNAFYNGSSINFYAAGGGCNSFANCGDIIYHEYGHGINDKFYNWQGAGTMNNGALNEGEADCWGISISHDPVLGKGSMPGSGGGMIRRYDQAPKVFPQDLVGEVHADGEIIAGAWWDVSQFSGDTLLFANLFAKTLYDTPDGADGTEGKVYHDVLISALMNDDNDANLSNGTPHFTAIVAAFAKHGIYLLGGSTLTHEEIPHPTANTPIIIKAQVQVSTPAFLSGVKMYYKERSASWDTLSMTQIGTTDTFMSTIPALTEGKIVDYYFGLIDNTNTLSATFPLDYLPSLGMSANTLPYQFGVGISKDFGFDFEYALIGWTIGNATGDNATSGKWIQAKPVGSFLNSASGALPVQPGFDHTDSMVGLGKCLVTGNGASTASPIGQADVDGGKTSVITQAFDLNGMAQPIIEYYRWFGNDRGNNPSEDPFLVQARDSSNSIWTTIENTKKSDYTWRRKIFSVKNTPGIALATNLIMQFVATDAGVGGSTVETAIDDIFIYDLTSVLGIGNDPTSLKACIYPNPANNNVMIELQQPTTGYVSINDLTGKQISHIELNAVNAITIPLNNVANGVYMISIKTKNSIQSQKLIVNH